MKQRKKLYGDSKKSYPHLTFFNQNNLVVSNILRTFAVSEMIKVRVKS